MNEDLVFFITAPAAVVIVMWLKYRARVARAKLRSDLHKNLIEKFSSAAEMASFLESPAAGRLLADEEVNCRPQTVKGQVLRSVRSGLILSIAGGGGLVIGAVGDGQEGLAVLGGAFLAFGVGFLVAAAVSYRLAKAWGIESGPASGLTGVSPPES